MNNYNTEIITCNSNISTLICSNYSNIFIHEDRSLFSFGRNEVNSMICGKASGYLGHEEKYKIIYPPKQIPNLMNIKMVACGSTHTVCIDYDGIMFTFGNNINLQLGIGKDKNELPFTHIPQQILDIPPIDFISCGKEFTVCISNERTVYSFGANSYGQLGIGNHNLCLSPQLIPGLNDIELITCGGNYTICKTYSNEYYSWGENGEGQLGQGNIISSSLPIKCANWPNDVVDIKCGYIFSLLLTSTGRVYSFGYNNFGQLGCHNISLLNIPTLINDIPLIKQIECGDYHSMCIDINNKLWVFGYNLYTQLGLGDYENRFKPTLNESLHDVIDISAGAYHSFVKPINNEIYVFGDNEYSQLGIKASKTKILVPVQVFKDKEEIWASKTRRSKQKSARK